MTTLGRSPRLLEFYSEAGSWLGIGRAVAHLLALLAPQLIARRAARVWWTAGQTAVDVYRAEGCVIPGLPLASPRTPGHSMLARAIISVRWNG